MNARKLGALTASPISMGCMGLSHGYGDIPDRAYSVEAIRRAHWVTPLSAAQSIYSSMVERGVVEAVIPYCLENHIGFVPFSPIARGFLSGKVTEKTDFSHSDDVRKYVPSSDRKIWPPTGPFWTCWTALPGRKMPPKPRSSSAGCCTNIPTSPPSPVPKIKNAFRKIWARGTSRSSPPSSPRWKTPWPGSLSAATAALWNSRAAA